MRLARAYVQGAVPDWSRLRHGPPRGAAAGYPFAREVHWPPVDPNRVILLPIPKKVRFKKLHVATASIMWSMACIAACRRFSGDGAACSQRAGGA